MIAEETLERVRQAADIVAIIGEYVELWQSETRRGKCPFCKENAFHVWPSTRTFKCFKCSKGGNSFHFLMEAEHLEFPEAVRKVAKLSGVEVPAGDSDD